MGKVFKAARSLAVRYLVVMLYILAGAAIFSTIENRGVEEDIKRVQQEMENAETAKEILRKEFSKKLNLTVNSSLFDELAKKLKNLSTRTKPMKWDMVSGAHFAFTIVSTIGYGVITPTIDATRVATIFYAMVGIPLFVYAMSAAGDLKKSICESILLAIEVKWLKRAEVAYKHEKLIGVTIIFFITELLCASAFVYHEEGWSFFVAFYFWFVTASTIGFGDYVLSFEGNNQVSISKAFVVILISLMLMSDLGSIFNTISEMLIERSKSNKKSDCICCSFGKRRKNNNVMNDQEGQGTENISMGRITDEVK